MNPTNESIGRAFSDALAQEIRRVDGNHSLGAAELADALTPFIARELDRKATGECVGVIAQGPCTDVEWTEAGHNLPVSTRLYAAPQPPAQEQGEGISRLRFLFHRYWELAYAEGKEGRDTDTPGGDAQKTLTEFDSLLRTLIRAAGEEDARDALLAEAMKIVKSDRHRRFATGYMDVDRHDDLIRRYNAAIASQAQEGKTNE